ncbi:139_t:CDS:2, partial [Racocetra fulgida]
AMPLTPLSESDSPLHTFGDTYINPFEISSDIPTDHHTIIEPDDVDLSSPYARVSSNKPKSAPKSTTINITPQPSVTGTIGYSPRRFAADTLDEPVSETINVFSILFERGFMGPINSLSGAGLVMDQVGIKNKEVINSVKNSLEKQARVISVAINETKDVVNALTRQIKILQEEIKEFQEEIRKLQENQREPQEELKIAATLKEIIKRLETVVEALREIVKRLEMIVEAQEDKKNRKSTTNNINGNANTASEDRVNEDEMSSEDEEPKFVVDYKLFVKTADENSLPTKWFKETVSTVDEFLLSIHNKILIVTKDNTIMPNDYSVIFKTQRETGAGTQLADEQDFIKFKSEYIKLVARKNTEKPKKFKNNNRVPGVSSLSSHDKEIAENVLKIRNEYHCNNKELATIKNPPTHPLFFYASISSKKPRSTLSSHLLSPPTMSPSVLSSLPSLQAQSIQPQLSQIPPERSQVLSPFPPQQTPLVLPPLLLQYNLAFRSQAFQLHQPLLPTPYNVYQTSPHISMQPPTIHPNPYISSTLPSMKEFLKEVDEKEETVCYY